MKKLIVICLAIFAVNPAAMSAIVDIDDGLSHTIDDNTYLNDIVYLDRLVNNDPGTHVDMNAGGVVSSLHAGHFATITMTGGVVAGSLEAWNLSTITLAGGTVGGELYVDFKGIIYLDGTGFEVDGTPLEYGDRLSDFGTFVEIDGYHIYTGSITGTLSDGLSQLNNNFEIRQSGIGIGVGDIIVVPEPGTILLLVFGGFMLRRRK